MNNKYNTDEWYLSPEPIWKNMIEKWVLSSLNMFVNLDG